MTRKKKIIKNSSVIFFKNRNQPKKYVNLLLTFES